MKNELIRTFLAIPITQNVLSNIQSTISKIKPCLREIRFVSVNNLHITLKFFGEITQVDIEEIHRRIETVVLQTSPFKIILSGLSAFPNMKSPRILWVGIHDSENRLKNLGQIVSQLLSGIGKEEDREFKAHLTIGRVKMRLDTKVFQNICEPYMNTIFGKNPVDRMILFKSDLKPEGPIHTPIRVYQFKV